MMLCVHTAVHKGSLHTCLPVHACSYALMCTWGELLLSAGGKCSGAVLDCVASAGQLEMPVEASVAHGDANLAFDDFLKTFS